MQQKVRIRILLKGLHVVILLKIKIGQRQSITIMIMEIIILFIQDILSQLFSFGQQLHIIMDIQQIIMQIM